MTTKATTTATDPLSTTTVKCYRSYKNCFSCRFRLIFTGNCLYVSYLCISTPNIKPYMSIICYVFTNAAKLFKYIYYVKIIYIQGSFHVFFFFISNLKSVNAFSLIIIVNNLMKIHFDIAFKYF